jgi:hypothetical protein
MARDTPADPAAPTLTDGLTDIALVPVAARHDGWTPSRQRAFLESLADTGSVTAAAQSVSMSTTSAYRLRARADARGFSVAWDAALERAMQRLFPAALDRALNGTLRQRFYHGEMIGEDRVYSDRLIVWLLEKGAAMLGGGRTREAVTDNWERAMDAIEAGDTEPPMLLHREPLAAWRVSDDEWQTNCPPPPDFRGFESGSVGSGHYRREMTREEREGFLRRRALSVGSDEAQRRRFFGLPDEPPAPRRPVRGRR